MNSIIKALTELENLKTVERGLNVGNRKESTAEHSWSCILIADILLDYTEEPLDKLKIFEYLLYHDIVEVYAGDAKFNNPEEIKLKHKKEQEALKKLASVIPNHSRIHSIIEGYEIRHNRESKFAKAIDCIDSCIRNLNDPKKTNKDGFTEELIRKKYLPHVIEFDLTFDLFEACIQELKKQRKL